jgi:hypothetical protein
LSQKAIWNIIAITLKSHSKIKSLLGATECLIMSVQIKEEIQNALSEIQKETHKYFNEINFQSKKYLLNHEYLILKMIQFIVFKRENVLFKF